MFPPEVYATSTNDVGVIDVKALFGAKGDGVTDDTAALVAAYDLVISRYRSLRNAAPANQNIIYLPAGTYLVSDSVTYSFPLEQEANGNEKLARVRFQGESEGSVVIRLKDNSAGFGAGSGKALLEVGKGTRNGTVASNAVQDITLDTGQGNPGAVGLRFSGANNAAVRRVTIRSSDLAGSVGLDLPLLVTQGSYERISIEGFDHAISTSGPRGFCVAFDHLRISHQRVSGLEVHDSVVSVRDLCSINTVPAARVMTAGGQLVLVSSTLSGGSGQNVAVDVQSGEAMVRDVSTTGYAAAVRRAGQVTWAPAYVSEHVTETPITLFAGTAATSLNLPVEDAPPTPWIEDFTQWANVDHFGAVGDRIADDSAAIQAAMDSGASVVCFQPGKEYLLGSTVVIPPTVTQVQFMYTHVFPATTMPSGDAMFSIAGGTDDPPLLLERLFGWMGGDKTHALLDHASQRSLLVRDIHHQQAPIYANSVAGGKVFLDNVSCRTAGESPERGLPGFAFDRQQVWVRFLDSEYGDPAVINHGSELWVLGGKFEGPWTTFDTDSGGRTEVLGSMANVYTGGWTIPAERPLLSSTDAAGSFTLGTYSSGNYYATIASETRGGTTRTLNYTDVPRRLDAINSFIPLYVAGAQA